MSIRVVLADDEQLMRTGLAMILRATDDLELVGEAADGRALVDLVARVRPDVALVDVRMPVLDGLAATREVVRRMGADAPKVVVLTTFDLDEHVHEALLAGASGFLLKDLSATGLADAVRAVAAGDALLAPSVTRRLVEQYRASPRRADRSVVAAAERLTDRERQVLTEVVAGLTNAEIGVRLHLAETTVKTYVGRLLAALGCRDRVQLVIRGYELGLDR